MAQQRVVQQHLHDWSWIGEAGRLQQYPAKRRDFALVAPHQQAPQRRLEIAAQGAADATARQHGHLAVDRLDQQMIDADFTPFVDDHCAVGHIGVAQQPVQQSRLAAAKETGDHRNGEPAG